ncbi:integrase, catalytic region, zinc finger, CCHC-type containing protein [Tanacetum coccineum]|uniref:Integrase, catalytic region, zinc finger, CCHC-type containing protein n=1 Tax=Tanacetum coccineum TaxID=301880 RepID=A0ABQ4ZR46_9ASTR
MVRSMMNLTTLLLSFWDYALESATRILNMVPTKKFDKTPYELWNGKVSNLSYLKVWGCEALVKRDTPDKLQQRSVKCIFIGYPKETMDYYFYFPPENKIVVARVTMSTLVEFMIRSGAENRPPMLEKHLVAKDLWERVQLLMQGTSLTKQQRECKLYDAFDKFAHIKRESFHQYYLRFTQLINDITIYKMKLEQFQVNTKFLNSLPPEWSKFVTDVKLVRDFHTTKSDQLHAYLELHELYENEVCIMREHNQDPLALGAVQPVQRRQSSFTTGTFGTRANKSGIGGNNSGQQRVVKCFNCQGEGHMARQCPNQRGKGMLHDPRVAEGPVTQTVITHNAAYQVDDLDAYDSDCDDFSTAKAVLMANLSKNEITSDSNIISYSQYLLKTQNAVVHDTNSSVQNDAMILFVFEQLSNQVTNCNNINKDNLIANESLSAELERYKERVKLLEERQNVDLSTREKLIMDDIIREKNAQFADFEKEINYLKQTLSEQSKEKELLTKTFNVFKNESKEKEAKNIDKEIALEKKVKELDNIVCKMGQSAQTVHMLTKPQVFYDNNLKQALGFQNPFYLKKAQQIRPMLYDGSVIAKETNVISIADSEETLMLEEESRSKMLLKQKLTDEQAFWLQTSHPNTDQSASSPVKIDAPWELPKVSLINTSLKKLKYHLVHSEQTHLVNYLENEITSDSNIIPYSQYLLETKNAAVQDTNSFVQNDAMILFVFEQLSNQVTNCNNINKDNLIANESLSAELERYKERVKLLEERQNVDLTTREQLIMDDIIWEKNAQFADFEKEINYLKQTLSEQSKEKELLTKTFNVFKNESKEKEAKNIDKEIALEKKVKELDNIVCKMGQSAQTMHMLTKPQVFYDNNLKQALGFQNPFFLKKAQQIRPMLYDGSVIAKETNVISIADSEETLMLEEESRSKMLLKQSDPIVLEKKVNIKPINYAELNRLSEYFGKRFVPQQELSDEQAFWLQTSHPNTDQSASSPIKIDAPLELPKVSLINTSLKKLKYHLVQFDNVVKKWINLDALTVGEWGFEHAKAIFMKEIIPFLKTLKDIF